MTQYNFPLSLISGHGLIPHIKELGENLTGCEIGVKEGANLRYFLDNIPTISICYAVDSWLSYECPPSAGGPHTGIIEQQEVDMWKARAFEVLDDYKEKIRILELRSEDAANHIEDNTLDYIFIDGDHRYDSVLKDLQAYWPKVKQGGIFAGHDWNFAEVENAVNQFRNKFNIASQIKQVDINTWFWYKGE